MDSKMEDPAPPGDGISTMSPETTATTGITPTPSAQVKVVFTAGDADPRLQLPETKRQLLVPADIRRYGLSRILNSDAMLATAAPTPFDFLLADGSFLHASLADHLRDAGLSLESTVTLRYVRSLVPPVYAASFEHDDWVSAVDVLASSSINSRQQGRILSGSYDGIVRVWNPSGQVLAASSSPAAGAAIKAARFATDALVVSASMDRSVSVWKYAEEEGGKAGKDSTATATLRPTLQLWGHAGSVDALDVEPAGGTDPHHRRILTASSDGSIGLWSTSRQGLPGVPAGITPETTTTTAKRRKTTAAAASSIPTRGPLALLPLHQAPASAAVFDPRDRTVGYSAGQDKTIKTIDLTTQRAVSTISTSHALLSLCALARSGGDAGSSGGGSAPLLAAGTAARHVTIVDPRASVAASSVLTLRGHTNKVVSVAPAPASTSGLGLGAEIGAAEHSLVSGSHDGTCRVWDLRSVRPARKDEGGLGGVSEAVYVIEREGGSSGDSGEGNKKRRRPVAGDGCKVFSVVWDAQVGIVSGGEDRRVQINRGKGLLEGV